MLPVKLIRPLTPSSEKLGFSRVTVTLPFVPVTTTVSVRFGSGRTIQVLIGQRENALNQLVDMTTTASLAQAKVAALEAAAKEPAKPRGRPPKVTPEVIPAGLTD